MAVDFVIPLVVRKEMKSVMCGIVGYVGKSNCVEYILDGLSRLEYRGYDSAGIAIFNENNISIMKKCGKLNNLKQYIKKIKPVNGTCGIGHTRWATHGKPSDLNSHPHSQGRVTIVHNGIIENYLQIKQFLAEKNYTFKTQTDSEIVAALLDFLYDKDPIQAIIKASKKLEGSYSLGILFENQPDKIYAIRKNSPLIIGIGKSENFIASDVPAIIKHTKKYMILDHDEIAILTKDFVKIVDFQKNKIQKKIQTVDWNVESAEKNGFSHFMLKEIYEQPKAAKRCMGLHFDGDRLDLKIKNLLDEKLKSLKKIHIVACGTAMHAGMVGKYIIEKLAKIPVEVEIASEFRYKDPIISKEDLIVIISQSGETADSLAALRLAKEKNVLTLAVVNVVGSSIAREANSVLYTHAGPEISVASTKAFTVQMVALYLLAIKLANVFQKISDNECCKLCEKLRDIPNKIEKTLKTDEKILKLSNIFKNSRDVFFIGRGVDYCISLEASLKLKELSYIHSEAYAAGELKHGTISLIEENTPVIAIATQGDLYAKTISNLKEVKARGAKVVLICNENSPIDNSLTDLVVKIPDDMDIFTPLCSIVPLQLFAYHTAVLRGCDVDRPRNLAKSVTVE